LNSPVRKFIHISLILALLALVVFLLTPSALVNSAVQPSLPADIESYIAERERTADERYGLIPETGKRIRWQASRQPTEYAVVYLHGFSATRQAFAPAAELVADALGANLFETRLAGHGRVSEPMADFHAEDWLDDAAEALTIGTRIGRKVVVIGTSTGADLTEFRSGGRQCAAADRPGWTFHRQACRRRHTHVDALQRAAGALLVNQLPDRCGRRDDAAGRLHSVPVAHDIGT
jgi:pimeloyl-ACP methyl ester carboxylesterase